MSDLITDIFQKSGDLFGGAAWRYLDSQSPAFFKPYDSAGDVAARVMTVGTAPLHMLASSLYCLVLGTIELFRAIGNACTGNFDKASENIQESGGVYLGSIIFLIAAVLSPLANLIDVIGSVLFKEPDVDDYEIINNY